MARIVILGGGFAGAFLARALGRTVAKQDHEVVLIDRHNYFVFTPLLIEAGTGAIEPRHAVVPLRDLLRSTTLRAAEVLGVDSSARTVRYRLNEQVPAQEVGFGSRFAGVGVEVHPFGHLRRLPGERRGVVDAALGHRAGAWRQQVARILQRR